MNSDEGHGQSAQRPAYAVGDEKRKALRARRKAGAYARRHERTAQLQRRQPMYLVVPFHSVRFPPLCLSGMCPEAHPS